MRSTFPAAVPEIPVSTLREALGYYERRLGFSIDWHGADGIAGVSRGDCRLFLTDDAFRGRHGSPVVIWLNLDSAQEVDALHESWHRSGATIVAPPETKPWGLHEFTAADPDGNRFRVFHDVATPQREG